MYLTTRSEARARQARDKLTKDAGIDARNVRYLVMDLYDPVSITQAVEELKKNETKLHILSTSQTSTSLILTDDIKVNNAAASTSSTMLVDGKYEQHMAAKYV